MSSLKVGIVGLPNVGKSTLFNALLKKRVALSANYPFATIEPNTGIVPVPDNRLVKLAELTENEEHMSGLPPIIHATVEFVDIAGLVKGASTGEGLGNQFLAHIREVDAIVHVMRDFTDPEIIRSGSIDPLSDRETIETELALADLQTLEKMVPAQEKQTRGSNDPLDGLKLNMLKDLQQFLCEGKILGKFNIGDERLHDWFSHLPLLSLKPMLYVFNVDERNYGDRIERELPNEDELVISAKLEQDLSELSDDDRGMYLGELGVNEPGLNRLIRKAYQLLGLSSYITVGKKEVKAWTIKKGMKAPQAAGAIHTDFEKKFIRAEVIEYEKLIEAGSHNSAKNKGWMRTEGKDYEVKDGDVIEFLIGS